MHKKRNYLIHEFSQNCFLLDVSLLHFIIVMYCIASYFHHSFLFLLHQFCIKFCICIAAWLYLYWISFVFVLDPFNYQDILRLPLPPLKNTHPFVYVQPSFQNQKNGNLKTYLEISALKDHMVIGKIEHPPICLCSKHFPKSQ